MQMRELQCQHDGLELIGQLAMPKGNGLHPAILVMHNAYGLGDHMRATVRKLAELGYVALASDMVGNGAYSEKREDAGALVGPLFQDAGLLRSRAALWLEQLKAVPGVDPARMAAIGYCFGGMCVLELARMGAELKAVISYHGILSTRTLAAPGQIKGEVVVFTGACDPFAPREQVEAFRAEMVAAQARWNIMEFGTAYHAFTDPGVSETPSDGLAYDPLADAVSWAATLAVLEQRV